MTFARAIKVNRFLMIANFVLLICLLTVFGWNMFHDSSSETLEASRIVLRGENGVPSIIMQGDAENTLLTLNDQEGNVRMQLQGGAFPALIMKNEAQEIVGTFFPLRDGGAAIGLGDAEGNMATFIRGGSSPTMSFYQQSTEPNLAMGISNHLPHFVMFPMAGREGMLIHGNAPTSVLFIDENGEIPVSLSRHGLFQTQGEKESTKGSGEDKIFSSWDELKKTLKQMDKQQ
ncbi:MAG: hypothetical protein KDK56_04765 [Simkania sp.]|nr:hypothetical protein [Simkania sp.]